ncbi:uncharacterized protein LOC115733733 isoform X2 [Rhodamnia argentea]|uniref:Uncharacterized protein LOC115733733 isoform X2 n=1 Tax=Rhodamnia argentea TaxID=178133 RepID=A0ABM3GTN0_9MYRT|nr:uncharacterized protein LOC115733733 isoform X2 [Rhodamnia argentea]
MAALLTPPLKLPNPLSSSFPHDHAVAGSPSNSTSHALASLLVTSKLHSHSFPPPRSHFSRSPPSPTRPTFSCKSYRFMNEDDAGGSSSEDKEGDDCSFDGAVALFNRREYYKCHDFLEAQWNRAEEPRRTLVHGILQCAVGFHHLFNQNHKGAMMELGEGLCKLRKMDFVDGPFHQFEREISAALDFIYQTQVELAACTEELCIAMDRSERSYQLLGGYGAGQNLYRLELDRDAKIYIVFCPERDYMKDVSPPRVKLPTLNVTEENLLDFR